ncbi:MAG TPA: response regulator [Anaeromyxobacteraceae bacterium]|nr:response regulator [Anaeromyxobacteraceae bacterium]
MELAAAFDRAVGERLLAAERLTLWLPELFGPRLVECDVGFRSASRLFAVVARLTGGTSEDQARFRFWCARSGGLASVLSSMSERERAVFEGHLSQCELRTVGIPPHLLRDAVARVVTSAGAARDRWTAAGGRPVLSLDAGSNSFAGVTFDPASRRLFIPGAIAPPVGDDLDVSLRVPRAAGALGARARVMEVRSQDAARPGVPAGFALLVDPAATAFSDVLGRNAPRPSEPGQENKRAAPRYAVNAPVRVQAEPTARLEYESDEELAADYVENLSQGGAYVRTQSAPPVGTRIGLEMRLPGGVELRTTATVAFRDQRGMGVKFELDRAGQEKLASVIARISARPRRALLVDDDALILQTLGDALRSRGFDVLTARDGTAGLQAVAEELLSLDLLVTDLRMPEMDGETFVRTIRGAGGESELAIVVIAGTLDAALERRLESAGADAVLDKALGPEALAAAAEATLERRRVGPVA